MHLQVPGIEVAGTAKASIAEPDTAELGTGVAGIVAADIADTGIEVAGTAVVPTACPSSSLSHLPSGRPVKSRHPQNPVHPIPGQNLPKGITMEILFFSCRVRANPKIVLSYT